MIFMAFWDFFCLYQNGEFSSHIQLKWKFLQILEKSRNIFNTTHLTEKFVPKRCIVSNLFSLISRAVFGGLRPQSIRIRTFRVGRLCNPQYE